MPVVRRKIVDGDRYRQVKEETRFGSGNFKWRVEKNGSVVSDDVYTDTEADKQWQNAISASGDGGESGMGMDLVDDDLNVMDDINNMDDLDDFDDMDMF
jgi:hypothetical protein